MHQRIREIHGAIGATTWPDLRQLAVTRGACAGRGGARRKLRHKRVMKVTPMLCCMMASTLTPVAGCDPEEGRGFTVAGEVEFRPIGGVWLNTSAIGPLVFSQLDLDGQALDGLTLTDVLIPRPDAQWLRLDKVEIVAGRLRGRRGSTFYHDEELLGSRWLLSPSEGSPVEMWISGYTVISSAQTRYTFQTLDAGGAVVHVCDPSPQGDYSAIPIKDRTVDPTTGAVAIRARTLYLGCLSGAVGKARAWGYGPEQPADFAAAIRMIRADYCGDGTSWTTEGTSVQVHDAWGINTFAQASEASEAVWTATGLACLTQPRWTAFNAAQVSCDGAPVPSCPEDVDMTTYEGALFWTKVGAPSSP